MKYIEHEDEVVKRSDKPNTFDSLRKDFKNLGVEPGSVVIMHSALSKLGWTIGGPVSVIQAMMDILTPDGTLIMPTFTAGNTEPSGWENPPVPEEWWPIIRQHTPAFEPKITPTRGMGIIVETFRTFPGVYRSNHPVSSFTVWGKHAKKITKNHTLHSDIGEGSPLARIYDLDGQILLLGVTHSNNTSLHLAEYRTEYYGKKYQPTGSAIMVKGKRKWVVWEELDLNPDDFEELGNSYEAEIQYKPKKVGLTDARLFSQRAMVDFAMKWISENRKE